MLPAVSLSGSNLDFGAQPVGSPSLARRITLTNSGLDTLIVNSIAVSGAQSFDFFQTNTCSAPVPVNGSCSIDITFAPMAGGPRTAIIAIASNAPGSPQAVTLSGSGTGLSLDPRTASLTSGQAIQFAATGPGSGSAVWSVDGSPGGSPAAGTITAAGLYTAPIDRGRAYGDGHNDQPGEFGVGDRLHRHQRRRVHASQ